jgi:hypothetical protein
LVWLETGVEFVELESEYNWKNIKLFFLNIKILFELMNIKKKQITTLLVVFILISLTYHSFDRWVKNELEEILGYYDRRDKFLDEPDITKPCEIEMVDSDVIILDGTEYNHPDKLYDIEEIWIYGTNETNPDTDGDGMEDGWEVLFGEIDPFTGQPILNPNEFDSFKDPDNDGWDADYNGVIDSDEQLTNLEEYCGGSYDWGPFSGLNLNPQEHYEKYKNYIKLGETEKANEEWQKYLDDTIFIQYHGGFHLIDYPYSEIILDEFEEYPIKETQAFMEYIPDQDEPVTPNPCDSDTDGDSMDDGYEIYFREKCEYLDRTYFHGNYNASFNPINSTDAELDFDIVQNINGNLSYKFKNDGLLNWQEFENRTDPTMYDTDNDSYFNPLTGEILWLSDLFELEEKYYTNNVSDFYSKSVIDWDNDGIINKNSDPTNPDTDSDKMFDGWELFYGLNPCNSSDRYHDLDFDGLPNFLEFAYPNDNEIWFSCALNDPDTDDDGIPDGWEAFNAKIIYKSKVENYEKDILDGFLNGFYYTFTSNPLIYDSESDLDGYWYDEPGDNIYDEIYHEKHDHLTNYQEYMLSIDPRSPDSDGDGLSDGNEVGYYLNVKTGELVISWKCGNIECEDYGSYIYSRKCPHCGHYSNHPIGHNMSDLEHYGGFHGDLISGHWLTDPEVASKYFTDPDNPNTDFDFQTNVKVNQSRLLDDWEEVNGMEHEALDQKDNDGDGEFGSPTTWIDINKDGFVNSFELSNYSFIPPITDETLSGGILGGYADGIDNDGDGEVDEYIDEDGEGMVFTPTDASFWDTDHDGLGDVDEIFGIDTVGEFDLNNASSGYGTVFTDPGAEDTDEDGLNDLYEITYLFKHREYITNPLNRDSDGDGLTDGQEWEIDFYPTEDFITSNNYDANGDGTADEMDNGILVNGIKIQNNVDHTNPRLKDTDGDDLPDGWEYEYGRTRKKKFLAWHDKVFDTKWDSEESIEINDHIFPRSGFDFWVLNPVGQFDKYLDPDGDGLNNWNEYQLGTDPLNIDTDYDGLPDYWEYIHGSYSDHYGRFNLNPAIGDTLTNDPTDDEDNDGNFHPCEEFYDGKDNDGDGEVVRYLIFNGVKTSVDVFNGKDDDSDGLVDESDEVSFINWLDDDGDGLVDEGIDEEYDLNDANEDYDWDGVWYTIAWVDDDGDSLYDEDPMDDDFDGKINEDKKDGFDNDLDGLIDEDTGTLLDDNDLDGLIDEDPKRYYHPFTNLMEYKTGYDRDNDGCNDITTGPNDADTDGDGISDGWEIWYTDKPTNIRNPKPFEDNDSLPRGWEELFNGSLIIFPTDYTPLGLQSPETAIHFVSKFNPTKADSDDNGILDCDENYDNDSVLKCNHSQTNIQVPYRVLLSNRAEYLGHSDPTDPKSIPIIETREFQKRVIIKESDRNIKKGIYSIDVDLSI